MKIFCLIIIISTFLFVSVINAFSINIDGINNGAEWDNASVDLLLNGESNSGITYAVVKNIIIAEENAVCLCFLYIDPSAESDNTNVGISITPEGSHSFDFDVSDLLYHNDTEEYSIDGAVTVDENHGATCEVRIGFKKGLPRNISLDVQFIDSSGAYSNEYSISVINSFYSEPTELIVNETDVKNTKRDTYNDNDYTLKKQTTKPEKKTTKFYIQTSPPYSYVRKTKAPKTTSAPKTTKVSKSETVKEKPATVYYEKEILVSYVYVTEESSTATEPSVTEAFSAGTTSYENIMPTEKKSVSLSKGTKYKIIIGIFAALSFTVIAAASTVSAKKSSGKDETPDSQ